MYTVYTVHHACSIWGNQAIEKYHVTGHNSGIPHTHMLKRVNITYTLNSGQFTIHTARCIRCSNTCIDSGITTHTY